MTDTASATPVADARTRLDELLAEQDGLTDARRQARADRDPVRLLEIDEREEQLPGEIRAARSTLIRAKIDAARSEADRLAAIALDAREQRNQARRALDKVDPDDEIAAVKARKAAREATAAYEAARDAAIEATTVLDDLDDELEALGENPRAEFPVLAMTVVLRHPSRGRHQFTRGTRPPRWAQLVIDNADAYQEPR